MTVFRPLACGYHSHTDASLDGGSTVETKIKHAAKIGRIADCVTDHGVMSALVPHWNTAEKLFKSGKIPNKIKSIHGIEAYVIDDDRPATVQKNGNIVPQYYHLTIHFKTKAAYEYFCQLTPKMEERAIVKWAERKPLMTFADLEPIAGQIVIGSGCLVGPVMKNIMVGRSDLAEKNYIRLRELAGKDNFFVEVFPHQNTKQWYKPKFDGNTKVAEGYWGPLIVRRDVDAIDPEPCVTDDFDLQKDPNLFAIKMAMRFNDPIVISLDDHYAELTDRGIQEVRLGNGKENWKFFNNYHQMTSDECAHCLKAQLGVEDRTIEEWIDNSYKFVDLFNDYKLDTAKDRFLLPTTEMVYDVKYQGLTNREIAWSLIRKHGKMPSADHPKYQEYMDRIEYELSVLSDNGVADFLPYFFVIEDAVQYAKSKGKLVNVRGSGGGCLLLYLFAVSITDPLVYGLPFERFLTIGRIKSGSLPDIDSDWEDQQEIREYILNKYGDKACLISTNMLMKLKSSILDCERSMLGYVRPTTWELTGNISGGTQGETDMEWLYGRVDSATGAHIPGFLEDKKDPYALMLRKYIDENPEIWSVVEKCIGITKTKGVHAAGVIITPEAVNNYMPLIVTKDGQLSTAYDMKSAEAVGAVKYDFLRVSTLKAIGIAMRALKKDGIVDLVWNEFPHDPTVYEETIAKNKTSGIFQINTPTMAPFTQRIKPKSVYEISNEIALVRPGALDSPSPDPADPKDKTAADYYVECCQGKRSPYFIHQDLEPILGFTKGIFLFQEQQLRVFRDLAGYSFEQAEDVRRGIGKKDRAIVEKHCGILKERCVERGWTQEQAQRLQESVLAAARYSFNMAHSASYGIVAYNGCYLKKNYPVYFWLGQLTIDSEKPEKLIKCLSECREYVLSIDIVKSHQSEWRIENGKIRPPLNMLKGCGEVSVNNLKNFIEKDLQDLIPVPEVEDVVE